MFAEEQPQLLKLPTQAYAACETVTTRIDKFSTARFESCSYSVPVEHAYQPCVVRGYLDHVEIFCEHECVATHARGTVSEQYVLEPRHYLTLLRRKPGALHNGRPFQGEPFGPDFALLRRELEYRYAADGTKQFLRVLQLLTDHPEGDVRAAVARCVERRVFNADAIENALRHAPLDLPSSRLDLSDRPELAQVGNGIRLAADYDVLFESQREESIESVSHDREEVVALRNSPDDHSLTVAAPSCCVDESHVDEAHVDEAHVDESHVEEASASRAALAPGPETASEPPSIEPPSIEPPSIEPPSIEPLLVEPPLTADRGADATPLAKTFASSPDAFALCCSEVEPDPVPLPRKEDAA